MKRLILSLTATAIILTLHAQLRPGMNGSEYCSMKKSQMNRVPALAGNIETGGPTHSFDVLDYTLSLDIWHCYASPWPKDFTATNTITFLVDSTLNKIKLNATDTCLLINSVGINGVSFTHANDTLTIQLNRTYNPGEIAKVRITYQHLNVTDHSFNVGWYNVFTDAEPEGARNWFPCWDHPYDKATVDLTVKVPLSVKLGSNGALMDSTVNGDTLTYHWQSIHNVSTYLTVLTSRVNYNLDVILWTLPSNPSVKVPFRFYYNPGEDPSYIESIILPMCDYFSASFCEHPFQKNGFATADSIFYWGGMENQTLTTFCPGCWDEDLTAHEFAHQWFGDMITCGTWADIWLNEGFATWCAAFWKENTSGYPSYKAQIDFDASVYKAYNPGWALSVPSWATSTPPVSVLFNYAITYCKGACVMHQLRYLLGDSLFFQTLKAYSADTNLKYKSAVTGDLMAKVNEVTGSNYDWFFNAWVYQPNHPNYQNTYNFQDLGNDQWKVNFFTSQIQTNAPFFPMLLTLRITFTDLSDTVIRVMNDNNYQGFNWTFNKNPFNLAFDPGNNILLRDGSTVVGIQDEAEKNSSLHLFQNIPNPASNSTRIVFEIEKSMHVKFTITDLSGREVLIPYDETTAAGKFWFDIDCSALSPGTYFYRMNADGSVLTRKMVVTR